MRKIVFCLLLMLGTWWVLPATAQDADVCPANVQDAVLAAVSNCEGIGANQLCYGSGTVEAIPRYLTAEFAFEDAGALLDVERVEIMRVVPPMEGTEADYSIALLNLRAGLPTAVEQDVRLVLLGEAFAANNVIPVVELEMTASTLTTVQAMPSDFSEEVLALVPGEIVRATGRVDNPDTAEAAWVRVTTDLGNGWVPANTLEEDFLLPSLPTVEPDEPFLAPMQSLTMTSTPIDPACTSAPDSGLLIQAPGARADLRVNGLDMGLNPSTTVYITAQQGGSMDVYVLQGAVQIAGNIVSGGQFVRYPLGVETLVGLEGSTPAPYLNETVQPLLTFGLALPGELLIVRGTDDPTEAQVEVPEMVVAATPLPGGEELALLPTEAPEVAEAVEIAPDAAQEAEETIEVADAVEIEPGATEEVAALPAPATEEVTVAEAMPEEPEDDEANMTDEADDVSATSAFAQGIRDRGTIRVGVNGSLPTFSLEVGDELTGFEPDLAQELVTLLFDGEVEIEWVQVSARRRESALAEGQVDLLVRNTSFTPERETWGEWTNTFYFVDGQRFLVLASSDIETLDDLEGRTIGAQAGTPAEATLNELAEEQPINIVPLQGTLIELLNSLSDGEVDAISSDWTALESIRQTANNPADYRVVGELLTDSPWSAAVPPGETDFRDEVDIALLTLIDSGAWLNVYEQAFEIPLPPSLEIVFVPVDGEMMVAEADEAAADDTETEAGSAPEAVPAEEVAVVPDAPVEEADADGGDDQPEQQEEDSGDDDADEGDEEEAEEADEPDPTPTPIPENAPPLTGDINVTIFTALSQERTLRITPDPDGSFNVELIRLGEVVYEARYQYYDSSERYENVRSSFEYIEFSDTAGDTSLGCGREPDIEGFLNGAAFEGKIGC